MKKKILSIITILAILLPLLALPQRAAANGLTPIYDIQYTTDPSGNSPFKDQYVTTRGMVTAVLGGGKYVWIQDGSGPWKGLYIYEPTTIPNIGDQVEVYGKILEYYSLTEMYQGNLTVLSSGNPIPPPYVLSTFDANDEQWESVLVRVEKVISIVVMDVLIRVMNIKPVFRISRRIPAVRITVAPGFREMILHRVIPPAENHHILPPGRACFEGGKCGPGPGEGQFRREITR